MQDSIHPTSACRPHSFTPSSPSTADAANTTEYCDVRYLITDIPLIDRAFLCCHRCDRQLAHSGLSKKKKKKHLHIHPSNESLYKSLIGTVVHRAFPDPRPSINRSIPCLSPVLSPSAASAPRSLPPCPTGTVRPSCPRGQSSAARSRVPLNCCRPPTCWRTRLPT